MAGAFFRDKRTATLFRDAPKPSGAMWRESEADHAGSLLREKLLFFRPKEGSYLLAYVFVWLFTLVLYVRPQELFPHLFEHYPVQLAKLFATLAPVIFFTSRLLSSERLFLWTKELQMAFAILVLGILFYPFSIEPADTWREWYEIYLKVFLIFAILVGTLNSYSRIYWMMRVTVLCGTGIALGSIFEFRSGGPQTAETLKRIEGAVGGMFGNANDLATTFGMLLPLAVVLLVVSRGPSKALYAACIVIFAMATLITFSRGGFLAMVAVAGVMMWKFRKRHRAIPVVAAALLVGVLFLGMPGGFGDRLWTIIRPNADSTGSAQERTVNLKRGILIFARHPLTGIGMGTFHIMGIKERRAHNSYLEIGAEVGVLGLLAYLVLIFYPFRELWKIEEETLRGHDRKQFETYVLSVGLQGTLVAYYANSFFSSIQYLWFVYYPIAYAVGLRLIYQREQAIRARVKAPEHLAEHHVGEYATGALWLQRQPGRAFAAQQAPSVDAPESGPAFRPEELLPNAAAALPTTQAVADLVTATSVTKRPSPPPSTSG
jgi:putative inorganic carbon (hco3(-)) transporter